MTQRRIVALLVAWLALAASAAPACAALLEGECCPAETCCVDAPAAGQALPGATARTGHDQRVDFDSPDSLIPASWHAVAVPVRPALGDRHGLAPADVRDGRGIYLRTGRLRL